MIRVVITLAMVLISGFSWGKVQVHEQPFKESQNQGNHFWMGVYDWKAWSQTPYQATYQLIPNSIKKAAEIDYSWNGGGSMAQSNFDWLNDQSLESAIVDYFGETETLEQKTLDDLEKSRDSAVVVAMKIQMDWKSSRDPRSMQGTELIQALKRADEPHQHFLVNPDWGHQLFSSVDVAHQQLETRQSSDSVVFSVMTFGADYSCRMLRGDLRFYLNGIKGKMITGETRIYSLSLLGPTESVASPLVDPRAFHTVQQKILFSSAILRSGLNIFSFYETPVGDIKVVLNSFIVLSSQLATNGNFLSALVNGISVTNLTSRISFQNGVASYNADHLFSEENKERVCPIGIGKGLPLYYWGLLEKMSQ